MDPKFKDMLDAIVKSHATLNIEEEVKDNPPSNTAMTTTAGTAPNSERTTAKIFEIAAKVLMDIVKFGLREKIPPSATPMIIGVVLGMIMEGLGRADDIAETDYFEAYKDYKGSNLDERTLNLVQDFAKLTVTRLRKMNDETGGL